MLCTGNSLRSGHQPGPRRDGGARRAAELAADPYHARAALTRLRRVGYAVEKLPRQNNGGSRDRIAGEPTEPAP